MMPETRYKNKRVLIMGLGLFRGGLGATKFLIKEGAKVKITDIRGEDQLREPLTELNGLSVEYSLGGHREKDFKWADIVLVNPAVPKDSPWLRLAKEIDTEMNLFFKLCKSKFMVGITGSNGKTTTTLLAGEMLRRSKVRVYVGGNVGVSLLERVDKIRPSDIVVLELSSFQLEDLHRLGQSPQVACVTNITPNHLDRHRSMDLYVDAKSAIVKYQGPVDVKILNYRDEIVRSFAKLSQSQTVYFGGKDICRKGDRIIIDSFNLDISGRKLKGDFNVENIMAASAICYWMAEKIGWKDWRRDAERVISAFKGPEHRLEFVCRTQGVAFYNDSIATNPDAVIKAIKVLGKNIHLIAGGLNKNLSFDGLARVIPNHVKGLYLLGKSKHELEASAKAQKRHPPLELFSSLEEAVRTAYMRAKSGDIVLLSPACASFDMFRNFEERGRLFKDIVKSLK